MAKAPKRHPLESEEMQKRLQTLQIYRRQARLAHLDNRQQQAIDADYYDGIQLTNDQLAVLEEREQPVQVWNITKGVVNWALGTEQKSRFDINVLPRKKADDKDAKTKTKVIKYHDDMSYAAYVRSQVFANAAKVGVGHLDIGAKADPENPLYSANMDWRDMWWDSLGKRLDRMDWRYYFMERWVDLDIAVALFEDRQTELENAAIDTISRYPYNPEDSYVFDDATDGVTMDYGMTFGQTIEGFRNRVKIIHMQYRIPDKVKVLNIKGEEYGAYDHVIYQDDNDVHKHLVKYGSADLEDAKRMTVRHGLWCNSIFLRDFPTPYHHNQFSWVPVFCYRRDRDGMPYGLIRDMRSPQDDVNARKMRAYFLMSAEKVIYEQGAIDESTPAGIARFADEYRRPDGIAKVAAGALSGQKIHFENGMAKAQQEAAVAREAEQFMHNIAGVTPEQQGQSKRDLSGVAIKALEQQGSNQNSSLFDNYFFAMQMAGELQLSNVEQFDNTEKVMRITGEEQKHEFVTINTVDEEGKPTDSITRAKGDFKISKTDYRETVRQGMRQELGELIQNLVKVGGKAQECGVAMLDIYVDLYDDMNAKEEMVARIRKITGQEGIDDDLTPQEKQAKQQEQAAKQKEAAEMQAIQKEMLQLEVKLKRAEVDSKENKAILDAVKAASERLNMLMSAMETAGAVSIAPGIVKAADTLIEEADALVKHPDQQGTPAATPQQPQPAINPPQVGDNTGQPGGQNVA